MLIILGSILGSNVLAHGVEEDEEDDMDVHEEENAAQEAPNLLNLEQQYRATSLRLVLFASLTSIIMLLIAMTHKKISNEHKPILFLGIVIPVIIATLFLAVSTIHLNLVSETGGPVHWHADFEIYKCGERLNIADPVGFSNRQGSSVFHEHNDDRIHVEGVVIDTKEVDLHNFFDVLGGYLSEDGFGVLTNEGFTEVNDGDLCNDKPGKLQVFLYKITNPDPSKNSGFIYEQIKLEHFPDYVLSPYGNVPPGDCIIVEFDGEKERTDNICETYKLAIERGDITGS